MEKRKIFQWLKRLKPEELELFIEYLRSPLHSNRPQLAGMIHHLIPHLTEEQPESLNNELYWEQVYPGKPYNANLLNRLLSEITSELRSYVGLLQYKDDLASQQVSIIRGMRNLGWDNDLPREIKLATDRLELGVPHDEIFFQANVDLAMEKIYFDSSKPGKKLGLIFQNYIEQLESFFVLSTLKIKSYIRNHDVIYNTSHTMRYEDALWGEFHEGKLPPTDMINIYWLIDKFQTNPNDSKAFEQFIDLLVEIAPNYLDTVSPSKIGKIECSDLFATGLNHCIFRINSGEEEMVYLYKTLTSKGLENGIFLSSGQVGIDFFTQMVFPLMRLQQFDLAREFIDEHSHTIDERERAYALQFLNGTIFYLKGEFAKANRTFLRLKSQFASPPTVSSNLNSRQLLCRSFFELGEFDSFIHEANALLLFTKRNKKYGEKRSKSYQNFVKYTKRLIRVIESLPDKQAQLLSKLKEDVKSTGPLVGKDWILQKIENEEKPATSL